LNKCWFNPLNCNLSLVWMIFS